MARAKWKSASSSGSGGKGGDSVVVAVRVRPFNDREKNRKAQLIIEMPDEKTTLIRDPSNPNDEPKVFSFDHSYWSHDGYKEESNGYLAAAGSEYADQQRVFNDLGVGVLDNAWKGYNCSLFAYGQTGSGKSYSMVGYKNNKGIVPIVCEDLFKRIGDEKSKDVTYEVFISMFEIYCEKVRDLLSSKPPPKGGLKVREHPKTGFYVEGLTSSAVSSYKEIEAKIEEGTKQRTIAATNMNATSSRAHTIVKLQFNQKSAKSGGGTTTKQSQINLVDLAGSERQRDAGSEGDRLKEGIVINQSLSTLGRVIKALHDQQTSGKKSIQIPYRDSVLTCLLKNALGGNSKTIMIAALSPADINYDETLSTLRFADRAKSIKTQAVVNESATERMIRELKEENARLADQIGKAGGGGGDNSEEIEALKRQLAENQREMENIEKSWQQKLAEEAAKRSSSAGGKAALDSRRLAEPHLWNLNEDPALTDVIVHFIPQGDSTVGNGSSPATIQLRGLSILAEHAAFQNSGGKVTLAPEQGASILVNGKAINKPTDLQQNDRILFGGNHLYVYANPSNKGIDKSMTYEKAQQEIAKHSGLAGVGGGGGGEKSKADMILEEELIALLPCVQRANAMSTELKRNVTFEIALVSAEARGLEDGLTEVWVKVYNSVEDTHFLWEKARFMSRYYGMQEMYENKIDGDPDWNLTKERDPFYEPGSSEVFLGSAVVFLQSLSYFVDSEEPFPVCDIAGNEIAQLTVSLTPCSPAGKEIRGEFVEKPEELVGKNMAFKVRLLAAVGLPRRVVQSRCKYRFYGEKETSSQTAKGSSPAYAHEQTYVYRPVTKELVDYLHNSNLYITLWGTQKSRMTRRASSENPLTTVQAVRGRSGERKGGKTKNVERLLKEVKDADGTSVSIKAVETALGDGDAPRKRSASKKKPEKGEKPERKTSKTREPREGSSKKSSASTNRKVSKTRKDSDASVKKAKKPPTNK